MNLPDRFRRLLTRRRITQSELAEAAGVTRQQVSRILSGSLPNPGILTVERIVEASGATMMEFYGDDGEAATPATQTEAGRSGHGTGN